MVLDYDATENLYQCQVMAFLGEEAVDWYAEEQLHEFRNPADVTRNDWKPGDHVHVRIRRRVVRDEDEDDVDGQMSWVGVWVKGTILRQKGKKFVVEHPKWDGTDKKDEHIATIDDLRAPY